jgi:hypothetical protein
MAQIKPEEIVDHLDSEMRRALEAAVKEVIPEAIFDPYALFRSFKRHVYRVCSVWENVPDKSV